MSLSTAPVPIGQWHFNQSTTSTKPIKSGANNNNNGKSQQQQQQQQQQSWTLFMLPVSMRINLDSTDIIYRGEGNSSLVVAIKSSQKVIRILKSNQSTTTNKFDDNRAKIEQLFRHVDYNKFILPNVFPQCFFSQPKLIRLSTSQLEQIRSIVFDKRPAFRMNKSISDCGYALLMPDYCCIPKSITHSLLDPIGGTLSIEIKPKQGFLSFIDAFNGDSSLEIKSKVCRFGMSQFVKLEKGSITSISSYCPINLFSGCRQRALQSISSLIENPQNNFRVFFNAGLIYGDEYYGKSGNVAHLRNILAQFFSHNNENSQNKCDNESSTFDDENCLLQDHVIYSFCSFLLASLYDTKIMKRNNHQMLFQSNNTIGKIPFLRSYLKMFDLDLETSPSLSSSPMTLTTPEIKLDTNGNISVQTFDCDIYNNNNNNNNNNNGTKSILANIINDNRKRSTTTFNQYCQLHNNRSKCICCCNGNEMKTCAPNGSILESILRAQQLDQLDTLHAAELYDQLCQRFHFLKTFFGLKDNRSNKLDDDGDDKEVEEVEDDDVDEEEEAEDELDNVDNFNQSNYDLIQDNDDDDTNGLMVNDYDLLYSKMLQQFAEENCTQLEVLWRYLISLTAKDCSIMIAIQRCTNNNGNNNYQMNEIEKTMETCSSSPMCTLITERSTGKQYVVSISITDLDFKQSRTIPRALAKDRRMIRLFADTIQSEPHRFTPNLVKHFETM
ncbi:hypothetical protein BLOT_010453 [Blomia tropicalis]|nr:hypothetical protein BLOT_010453 [Blomia tropicalis]